MSESDLDSGRTGKPDDQLMVQEGKVWKGEERGNVWSSARQCSTEEIWVTS